MCISTSEFTVAIQCTWQLKFFYKEKFFVTYLNPLWYKVSESFIIADLVKNFLACHYHKVGLFDS